MPNYSPSLSSKLPRVETTIFTVMSKLAKEEGAINLSQGFPGFDAPEPLKASVAKAIMDGNNQYAPMQGLMELREAVAEDQLSRNGVTYHPETEVTITAGATQAIFTAISALIKEGDEVILFTPAYDCYAPAVELAGGSPVYVQLKGPTYSIDWQEVQKLVNRKTRMILINSPHNPTGTAIAESDLVELEKIVEGSDIIVLSDEVYEHIVFDDHKHHSCASRPVLANHALIVGSFGKTFHVTGWKTGYICGPKALMAEFQKVHQYNVFCVNHPVQKGIAEFMKAHPEHLGELGSFYQKKRDTFLAALEGSRFSWIPASGTYFQLLNYASIRTEDDVAVAKDWTKSPGVASIPVSVFYHNPVQESVLRFCFAKPEEELKRAADILANL